MKHKQKRNKVTIKAEVPIELKDRLYSKAKEDSRTVTSLITIALEDYIAKRDVTVTQ